MPLSHITKVFAVTDAKMTVITADVAGAVTTYAAASIDLPGIKSFKITGTISNKTLRGDNALLDSDSVMQELSVSVEHAKLSLDALAGMLGTAVTDIGTTPAQTAAMSLTGAAGSAYVRPRYFKLEAVSASADPVNGNLKFALAKCVLSKFPDLGLAEEDYMMASFEAMSMPCLGTGFKWFDVTINETAAVLA